MPALKATEFYGEITWLGRVANREAALAAERLESAELEWSGIAGEAHGGVTRASCSRVLDQHPRGTEIRNVRQLSVLSTEDLAQIATRMELEGMLEPSWLGASLVLAGLPDLTHLPPSSRLQAPSGATLVVDMENRPCHLPAPVIEETHPGFGKRFKAAANALRGVTAWVERPGGIALGDKLRLHIPDQPAWPHLEAARGG
ncbi:sulfurase [Rhodobacteraceae bacterium D3-12]|nr:sulfurase [Rhodobacteraceae bacterium D3-12]